MTEKPANKKSAIKKPVTNDEQQETQHNTAEVDALITRCLQGDQTGYADLYDHFAAGAYRLCYSLLMNQQDAEDILQDTFVYAFRNLARYDNTRAAFKTWLYTIAVSRCRNTYRRKRFPTVDITQVLHLYIPGPSSENPEAQLAQRNAADAIQVALTGLSPRLREAIVLRYGHGLTYREIAEVMGCPAKTAESRVRLGHERLRGLLQPAGRALLEELARA